MRARAAAARRRPERLSAVARLVIAGNCHQVGGEVRRGAAVDGIRRRADLAGMCAELYGREVPGHRHRLPRGGCAADAATTENPLPAIRSGCRAACGRRRGPRRRGSARARSRAGDALLRHQAFERGEPVPVVGRAEVRVARRLRPRDLRGERRRPLAPGEQAARVERDDNRKGLRFPTPAEYRPAVVARDARDRAFRLARRRFGAALAGHG